VVETRADVVARRVIEPVEQHLFLGGAGQKGVRGGVVLPERPGVAGLPAFDGFGRGVETGVRGEVVLEGPAADAGAVGSQAEAALEFAGTSAVGGGGLGGEQFGEQGRDGGGPRGQMIAARNAGRPSFGLSPGARPQVVGVNLVKAGERQSQFPGGFGSGEFPLSMAGQEVANEGRGQTFDQL
jgi:hypothetical protein